VPGRRYETDAAYGVFVFDSLWVCHFAGASSIRSRPGRSLALGRKRRAKIGGRFGRRQAKFTRGVCYNNGWATPSCPIFGKRVTNNHSTRGLGSDEQNPNDHFGGAW